jgi:hypothetical protein
VQRFNHLHSIPLLSSLFVHWSRILGPITDNESHEGKMWTIQYNKTGPQGRAKLTNGVGAMSGGQACQWSLLHSLHWADPACLQTQAELHHAAHPTGEHKPNMLGSGNRDNFQTQLNPADRLHSHINEILWICLPCTNS